MSFAMTKNEREMFLADLHVGIVSIPESGRGPLAVPVWYIYEPGKDLWFLTAKESKKGKLLQQTNRISLCVQTETRPYKYVTIEGSVTLHEPVKAQQHLEMACRYLGEEGGRAYVASESNLASIMVSIHPEHWSTYR